jgi:peptide/nickel transport system substrate-binding protein
MDFATMDARDLLFTEALERSMLDSEHVWLINMKGFSPRRAETTAAYDLAGGLWGSDLWPYTVRFLDQEGGVVEVARPVGQNEPWNPLAGTAWIWDEFPRRATQDGGVVRDPNTGLMWPQRIEGAEVTVQTGLPVTLTLDWVTLETLPTIEVPSDAWVDWDATNQVWITAGEPQLAKMKSVVTYPADLFDTVYWHDGSPLSVADFVMRMILPFDVANPDSAIYDESQVEGFDAFMSTFKGYHITSTDPLVIEVYSDDWELDAELNVQTLWPNYGRGEGAWHNMAVAYRADESQVLAFSASKANDLEIEWMDFVGEPSLTSLKGYLDQAQTMNFIPYANTLSTYVTPVEATARYTALQAWVAARGHFWLGTGPFYLDSLSHVDGTLTLQRFPAFPDPAGKWDHFSHDPSPPALELNYNAGAPGSSFNVVGTHFPINSLATVSVNREGLGTVFTGASGAFTVTLTTDVGTDEGYYITTVSVNPSASTMFMLDALEPLHEKEGDHESYDVPDGIAIYGFVYLPLVMR